MPSCGSKWHSDLFVPRQRQLDLWKMVQIFTLVLGSEWMAPESKRPLLVAEQILEILKGLIAAFSNHQAAFEDFEFSAQGPLLQVFSP